MAVNNSVNLLPSDVLANKCYFGKSEYPVDPYLNAQMDSAMLSSSSFSSLQIKQAFLQAPLNATQNGSNLVLSWPSWASSMRLYSSTTLPPLWTVVTNLPVTSNNTTAITVPNSAPANFYRLQWP